MRGLFRGPNGSTNHQSLGARNGCELLRVVVWQEALFVLRFNSFSRAALSPQPLQVFADR